MLEYGVSATQTLLNNDYRVQAAGVRPAVTGEDEVVTLVTGMAVTTASPVSSDPVITPGQVISARFSRSVNPATVSTGSFTVRGRQSGRYPGDYVTQENIIQFNPGMSFKPGEEIVVSLSRAVESADGIALLPYTWQFRAPAQGGSGRFNDSGQQLGDKKIATALLGDLDGDGDLDALAVSNSSQASQGYYQVWLNDGTGVYTPTAQLFTNRSEVAVLGDLDGDGNLDAIVDHTIWLNDGTGFFSPNGPNLDSGLGHIGDLGLGDLDGDGDLDVYGAIYDGSSLAEEPLDVRDRIWLNDGAGHFSDSDQRLGASSNYAVSLGDLDGDGDLDVYEDGQIWWNDSLGHFTDSGQQVSGNVSDSNLTRSIALGDLDGDGDLDAYVANGSWWPHYFPNQTIPNTVWINDGAGQFSDSGQRLGDGNSYRVTLGDLDGDGDLDAFVANYLESNEVWLNRGDGVFEVGPQTWTETDNSAADLGDLDGDGDLDAFVGTTAGSQVWLNRSHSWHLISTSNSPPVFGEHAMAYDSARDMVVLYGGNADGWPYEDTTWEFDGADWIAVTPTTTPTARYGSQMAYLPDSEGGIILFGGSDESDTTLSQTWVYTNATWSQLQISGPPSRTYHSLASNPISGTLYLFGGNDGDTYFDDLWQFENGDWTPITPANDPPLPRTLAALTYDTTQNRLLLFGGRTVTGTLLADLWTFDPSSNTWTELDDGGGGSGPPARMAHSLTYDPATGQAVLVGGVADATGDTRLGDTWHYSDTAGWVEANPDTALPPQAYHQAVYIGDSILLFSNGEVWRYE